VAAGAADDISHDEAYETYEDAQASLMSRAATRRNSKPQSMAEVDIFKLTLPCNRLKHSS
jgi:hypothetical protein